MAGSTLPAPRLRPEYRLLLDGGSLIAGVDEAGRGPLAGPVVAAAVVLAASSAESLVVQGLDDSKRLSPQERERLAVVVRSLALGVGVGQASREEIDRLNILQASLLAMSRAVAALPQVPGEILVDGRHLPPDLPVAAQAVVGGDRCSVWIAAASVIAKVTRDGIMAELDRVHPGYGWDRNQGYPTTFHLQALQRLGVTDEHRRTFGPVRRRLLVS